MFRGINSINIDSKGRLAIPARYRPEFEVSNSQLIITIDTEEKCLLLYPYLIWEEIERKIESLPSFNPVTRRIQRLLIGHATEVEIDNQGRILIPNVLREYADLKREAMLVGQGKKIELWSQSEWESRRNKWLEEASSEHLQESGIPEALQSLSL